MEHELLIDIGKRIKAIRKTLGIKQQDFAKEIGFSTSFLSEAENAKYKPGLRFYNNILQKYNVNLNYLLTGKGEMFNKTKETEEIPVKKLFGPIQSGDELIWYIKRSPLFMHTLMGFATRFLYENKMHIKIEIEEYQSNKEEKS
jgi:transcriptional regulator with XRE-family HTH domain